MTNKISRTTTDIYLRHIKTLQNFYEKEHAKPDNQSVQTFCLWFVEQHGRWSKRTVNSYRAAINYKILVSKLDPDEITIYQLVMNSYPKASCELVKKPLQKSAAFLLRPSSDGFAKSQWRRGGVMIFLLLPFGAFAFSCQLDRLKSENVSSAAVIFLLQMLNQMTCEA